MNIKNGFIKKNSAIIFGELYSIQQFAYIQHSSQHFAFNTIFKTPFNTSRTRKNISTDMNSDDTTSTVT